VDVTVRAPADEAAGIAREHDVAAVAGN
jgi:hypothetical protein